MLPLALLGHHFFSSDRMRQICRTPVSVGIPQILHGLPVLSRYIRIDAPCVRHLLLLLRQNGALLLLQGSHLLRARILHMGKLAWRGPHFASGLDRVEHSHDSREERWDGNIAEHIGGGGKNARDT
jgi:hypothetical protein